MRNSLLLLCFACLGVFGGIFDILPQEIMQGKGSMYVLFVLLFLVGMGIGFDLKALLVLREMKLNILYVPFSIFAGSMLTGALAGYFIGIGPLGGMTVASAVGYYSLSSILITEWGNPELASICLLANVIRELVTLAFPLLLIRLGGKLGPVVSSGAAAMDTCLPNISQYCGERYALIGIFSGMVLTLFVPILIPFLLSLQ